MIAKLNHKGITIAKKIHCVFQVSYAIESKLLDVKDFPPLKRSINDLQKSNTSFFGFWKDECLAAVIEIEKFETSIDICSLIVDPVYFRQGIATKLLRFARKYFNSETITVETALANKAAISLYKNFGFKELKQWQASGGIRKIKFSFKNDC